MTDAYHMKKVILNDQRLVFKIVRPNELLSIIRNYTFHQKYQDGHLYAIEELRWISPGGVGYGVMISSDNEEHTEPYMYVTVRDLSNFILVVLWVFKKIYIVLKMVVQNIIKN